MKATSLLPMMPLVLCVQDTVGFASFTDSKRIIKGDPDVLAPQIGTTISNNLQVSRREAAAAALTVSLGISFAMPSKSSAASTASTIGSCRPNSLNCIQTEWSPPKGTSKVDVVQTLRNVIQSYPKSGQQGVDCNGWSMASDDLEKDVSTARIEYKSCVGPAAVAVNFGQPFVDDLKLQIEESSGNGEVVVQVRSASRKGSSDLGVNKKRVDYLAKALAAKGWSVGSARYEPDWYIGNQ